MKWCGDEKTEPMENLQLGNRILASAIMKKLRKGCHSINMYHMETFQMTDLPNFGSLVNPTSHLCVVLHFLIFVSGNSTTFLDCPLITQNEIA